MRERGEDAACGLEAILDWTPLGQDSAVRG